MKLIQSGDVVESLDGSLIAIAAMPTVFSSFKGYVIYDAKGQLKRSDIIYLHPEDCRIFIGEIKIER